MRARRWTAASLLVLMVAFGASSPAHSTATPGVSTNVMVVTFKGAGFRDVFARNPRAYALASLGGAALVSQRLPLTTTLQEVFGPWNAPYWHHNAGSVAAPDGTVDTTKLSALFDRAVGTAATLFPEGQGKGTLIFVSSSPSASDVRGGDELGVVIMATGTGTQIQAAMQRPAPSTFPALTSDSTRRDGAVTTSDIAVTIASLSGTPIPSGATGAPIHPADAPAPFDLYQRYRDQRRLTVPIGIATGTYAAIVGLFALGVAYRRRGTASWVRGAAACGAISILPLGLALLEVGRFPRLTYAGVIPFLIGVTVVLTTAATVVARRRGAVSAVVALGVVAFCVLSVEAVMDWPGAVTPLLGGSQLDGGRFFGLPNAFIGLVLAAAVFVALALRNAAAGAGLLFVTGLVVGSPWFGSDLGGALTMCAVAGLWWSVRTRAHIARAVLLTGAAAVVGAVLVLLAQRYLASSPTHITHFAEGSGRAGGIMGTIAERSRIGVTLLVTHPFAAVPVLGVPVALWVALRPGPRLGPVLRKEPAFTGALITILLGSIIAYAVNDTGASALGLGFAWAVAALLFVSLVGLDETVVVA